jgi:4-amino-4-deoxy-L-arabinose transferase-like glycosyltransferase
VIVLAAALAFLLRPGARNFENRDVSRYAQMAFEMRHDGTLVPTIRRRPYHEATPLIVWSTLAVAQLEGGVSPLASRLLPALASIGTIALVFVLGLRANPRIAVFAASAAALNALAITHGRMSRVDPVLALAITGAMAAAVQARTSHLAWHVVTGVALALGVAAKGPLALVIAGGALVPWLAFERDRRQLLAGGSLALAVCGLLTAAWLVPYARYLGPDESRAFFDQFLLRENVEKFQSGYGKALPWWTYLVEVFPAFVPWIVPALVGAVRVVRAPSRAHALERLALAWVVFPFAVFSIATGKHIRYLLPIVPALALLAAFELDRWLAPPPEEPGRRIAARAIRGAGVLLLVSPVGLGLFALRYEGSAWAVALALLATGAGVVTLRARDVVDSFTAMHVGACAVVAFVFAVLLVQPELQRRHAYVRLAESVEAGLPGQNVPLALADDRPATEPGRIDEAQLGLYLGRWVDRVPSGAQPPGYVLALARAPGRPCLARVTWPTKDGPEEVWYLLGPFSP